MGSRSRDRGGGGCWGPGGRTFVTPLRYTSCRLIGDWRMLLGGCWRLFVERLLRGC